jgi:hypothetical protein
VVLCIPVDSSPLYEDPAEVRSADRPCALDICNTARNFTHESSTCVIRRRAFLILGCIDLLSCIPPPTTLLSTIFGWGAGSWHRPRTHVRLKSETCGASFIALLSVCAQRRVCATTPQPALLFSRNRPTLHLCCQMSLPWRAAPPPSYRNASMLARGPWLA